MRKYTFIYLLLALLLCGCEKEEFRFHPDPDDNTETPESGDAFEMRELHVEGRFLCNDKGERINLHGFGQTYSPWFNEQGNGWGWGYNVNACLNYNQKIISNILYLAKWKVNWLRLHMDPHWSNDEALVKKWQDEHPGENYGENHIDAFSVKQFEEYLSSVFVPMAQYAIDNKLYVVMRPPGVCPDNLKVGDAYQQYLLKVWKIVVNHKALKNNPYVMFELANEPINMYDGSRDYTSWSDGSFQQCSQYFQDIVDMIRAQGAKNILWVPGLGYQSQYAGYKKYPIKGDNIGYAVHCYPGWYKSDCETGSWELGGGHGDYNTFKEGWTNQVMPVATIAPILVTEMDWAPEKYNKSWGKATTGVAGGKGFGANFMRIMDETENVSWMLFTGPELLAKYDDSKPDGGDFLTDPEACVRPIYRRFQEYANKK